MRSVMPGSLARVDFLAAVLGEVEGAALSHLAAAELLAGA